jgi:hypothetical protein
MSHPRFTSAVLTPRERGREFGETWRARIAATVDGYRGLFAMAGTADLSLLGEQALARIDGWAPDLGEEIRGLAEGAGLPLHDVAAANARTEILAMLGHRAAECSAIVALGAPGAEPVAVQTWDWYAGFADKWLVWTIPHSDGRQTTTLTEFGIVGKLGVNSRGVGCLFNILHHQSDGAPMGISVHVVARRLLDEAGRTLSCAAATLTPDNRSSTSSKHWPRFGSTSARARWMSPAVLRARQPAAGSGPGPTRSPDPSRSPSAASASPLRSAALARSTCCPPDTPTPYVRSTPPREKYDTTHHGDWLTRHAVRRPRAWAGSGPAPGAPDAARGAPPWRPARRLGTRRS